MCSENYGTITELLVLEFDKKRSKNNELLELGLELVSLLKSDYITFLLCRFFSKRFGIVDKAEKAFPTFQQSIGSG